MPTLGEELRQKREQRGVTLAEISEATRIGTRFLKAIETDSFSILPGGIFTRSFIRAYAKYVGMNEDEAIALYLQQVNPPAPDQPATAEEPPSAPTKRSTPTLVAATPAARSEPSRRFEPVAYRQAASRISWPTIVIGGGIVVFVVLIVLAVVKQLNKGGQESASEATSVPQKNAPAQPPQNVAPRPSPSTETQQPPAQSPPGTTLVVKLEAATGDSWIRYQIDDAKPTTLILKQGQSQDLPPAQTQIALSYGNRMTLKLKINNRDANFPPDTPKFASQVIISRDNFQTYFQ